MQVRRKHSPSALKDSRRPRLSSRRIRRRCRLATPPPVLMLTAWEGRHHMSSSPAQSACSHTRRCTALRSRWCAARRSA